MPYRKKKRAFRKRRGGRRRTYNKRGHKGNRGSPRYLKYYAPGRNPSTLPQNFQVKLVYSENHIVFTAATNFLREEYNPSNYLSPRSGDTQSYKLFDHLVDLYEVFVPMAYKISVHGVNQDDDPVAIGLYMRGQSTTAAGDMDTALQQTKVVYRILSGMNSGRNQGTVSSYRTTKQIMGVNPLYEEQYWSVNGVGASRSVKIDTFYKDMSDTGVINVPVITTLITYTRMMTRDLNPVVVESALQTAAEAAGVVPPQVIISPISNFPEDMKVQE